MVKIEKPTAPKAVRTQLGDKPPPAHELDIMYHLLPLRRGTTFEIGNPDTMLARKAQD